MAFLFFFENVCPVYNFQEKFISLVLILYVPRAPQIDLIKGAKNMKNERSFKKMNIDFTKTIEFLE